MLLFIPFIYFNIVQAAYLLQTAIFIQWKPTKQSGKCHTLELTIITKAKITIVKINEKMIKKENMPKNNKLKKCTIRNNYITYT